MLREFKLPDLGEGLTESEIVTWRVAAGDRVELNQIIADVETAKAVVELPSPVEGVVQALHAEPGETVDVGALIVTFDVGGDAPAPRTRRRSRSPRRLRSAPKARVSKPPPAEPDDPADAPEPNLVGYGAGPDRKGHPVRRARVGAHHGAHLLVPAEPEAPAASSQPPRPLPPPAPAERPRSTPPVRHLAEQLGVDLDHGAGTGPDGLITREDVQAASTDATDVARSHGRRASSPPSDVDRRRRPATPRSSGASRSRASASSRPPRWCRARSPLRTPPASSRST